MNTITPLTRSEVPQLLELIRELAEFEKLEQELQTTVPILENSFFGPQPAAGAFLARCNGKLAGYAIYFFTFSSFIGRAGIWLEDLYVRPEFRKRGLGLDLIKAVARVGVERNCGRFEWTALDWNENALNFYDKLGAKRMGEWTMLRMNAAQMSALVFQNLSSIPISQDLRKE
jgi:GNAT superfamily N-acetyltransferase